MGSYDPSDPYKDDGGTQGPDKILPGNVQQLTDNGNGISFKKLLKKVGHTNTRNLVCPYCGYADQNSWELSDSEDRHMCGNCGKEFGFERVVYCEYTSWVIEDKH